MLTFHKKSKSVIIEGKSYTMISTFRPSTCNGSHARRIPGYNYLTTMMWMVNGTPMLILRGLKHRQQDPPHYWFDMVKATLRNCCFCVATIITFQENEWRKYDVKKYYAIIQEQGMILLPKFATNKQFPWGLDAGSDPHLDRLYILHRKCLCLCNQAFSGRD